MDEQVSLLVQKLSEEGQAVRERLSLLTPEQWECPVYGEAGHWTAHDLLAHLVAAERGHQLIIGNVAQGGPGAPPELNIDRYNERTVRELRGRDVAGLLSDFASVRRDTVALVSGLSDSDLQRRGQHPALGSDAPLSDMIRIVFLHGRLHLKDLRLAGL